MTTTDTAPTRPAGRALKIIGVCTLVLGMLAAALGVTIIVRNLGGVFVDSLSSPVYTVPVQATFTAKRGNNLILQESAYRNNPTTNFPVAAIGPDDVDLTGPDGAPVTLTASNSNYSVTRNSDTFFEIMKFQADTAGEYHLAIYAPAGLRLIVAPGLGAAFGRAAPWFGVTGLGVLLLITGAILLIVGFVRSGKAKRKPLPAYGGYPGYASPPPGWYPDPGRPGASRWWDGTYWRP